MPRPHPHTRVMVYGTDYWDRAGVHHINGPFTTEAQAGRDLERALRIDPEANSFQTNLVRFMQVAHKPRVVSAPTTGRPITAWRTGSRARTR